MGLYQRMKDQGLKSKRVRNDTVSAIAAPCKGRLFETRYFHSDVLLTIRSTSVLSGLASTGIADRAVDSFT